MRVRALCTRLQPFGEDDFQTGKRERLPLVNPLDVNGIFDENRADYEGSFAKDADSEIVKRLKKEGSVVDQDVIMHAYPHCYRTDQPLLYMAISTGLFAWKTCASDWWPTTKPCDGCRKRWAAAVLAIGWPGLGIGTSPAALLGYALPIWVCDTDPEEMVCIGSVQELEGLAGLEAGTVTDLHRDHVDQITFPLAKDSRRRDAARTRGFRLLVRVGLHAYAQNHYPFENKEEVGPTCPRTSSPKVSTKLAVGSTP